MSAASASRSLAYDARFEHSELSYPCLFAGWSGPIGSVGVACESFHRNDTCLVKVNSLIAQSLSA